MIILISRFPNSSRKVDTFKNKNPSQQAEETLYALFFWCFILTFF